MKEFKIDKQHCIGAWFIPKKVCDGLISIYNDSEKFVKQGVIYTKNGYIINTKIKESKDIHINNLKCQNDIRLLNYNNYLQKVINLYSEKYPEIKEYDRFFVKEYNIQKYPKNGGFKSWHTERACFSKRIFVFMTYLNTLKKGGTMFKYQKITTPAIKGLTLIWPTDHTHTHKSEICNKEKIISTGWIEFI